MRTTSLWISFGCDQNAASQGVTVAASREYIITDPGFVADTQEQFCYDFAGNLANDGPLAYTWDAENPLTKVVPNTSVGWQASLKFGYHSGGRESVTR